MQQKVRAAIRDYRLSADVQVRYIDAVSELGELGKAILRSSEYGACEVVKSAEIVDEMGDCLFSMLALCEALGVEAEDALSRALHKYSARFEGSGNIGSGEKREEE